MRAISGSTSASRPVSSSNSKARRARPSVSILVSSSRTRSRLTDGSAAEAADGLHGGGVEFKAEARGKAHGAQHAQVVFFKALAGRADGADEMPLQVAAAADVVEQLAVGSVRPG
jgi:hypothetical protein